MIELIHFNGKHYPLLQAEGYAAQYARPFAQRIIQPENKTGYDIGCNREAWKIFPNAIAIDPVIDDKYDAFNLPRINVDYIFSSHCLEHLRDWVGALDYWQSKLHEGGILFLYLPHPSQEYWLPHNNRKHLHVLFPDMVAKVLNDRGWKNIFVTGYDLNYSYYAICEK